MHVLYEDIIFSSYSARYVDIMSVKKNAENKNSIFGLFFNLITLKFRIKCKAPKVVGLIQSSRE